MADNSDVVGEKAFIPKNLKDKKFVMDFSKVISEFKDSIQKFPVKKILYKTVFRGKGLEFDSYRNFGPDDDASLIDWRASLRANKLLARKYIEERNLDVYFLVDVSSSMLFGSQNKLKAEYAAEFIAALSHLVLGSGDRIGLVMFSDNIVKIIHPSSSKNQFSLFAKFLSDPSLYGGGFNLKKAVWDILRIVKSEYVVFVLVSDFINTRRSDERSLSLMGARFDTIAVMVRDQLDERLPDLNYQFVIQDPYSGRQMILDPDIAARRYRDIVIHQKAMLKNMFRKSHIDMFELSIDKSFVVPIASFLKNRATGGRV